MQVLEKLISNYYCQQHPLQSTNSQRRYCKFTVKTCCMLHALRTIKKTKKQKNKTTINFQHKSFTLVSMGNFKDRLQKYPVLVDALLLTRFNNIKERKKSVHNTFSSLFENSQICITIRTFFHVFSKSRRGRGFQNENVLHFAFAILSLVVSIPTQALRLHTNFDHFKYSLRVNNKTFYTSTE